MDPSTSGLGCTRLRTNPTESGCEELPEGGGRAAQARRLLQAPQGTVVFERKPLPDELLCPICSELLREACCPSHCGHWFCEECLKEHFSKNGGSCPICRTKCEKKRTVCQHVPRTQISELKVHCRYGLVQSPGGEWLPAEAGAQDKCSAVFTRDALAAHEQACPFAMVTCGFPGCVEEVLRSELETHEKEAMAKHLKLALEKLEESQRRSEALQDVVAEMRASKMETMAEVRASKEETMAELRALKGEVTELKAMVGRVPQRSDDIYGGCRVVCACYDGSITVLSGSDGRCLMTLKGHEAAVDFVAVLPGGDRVVSAYCVVVLPGNDRLVSASEDKTLKVWSVEDGSCLMTLKGHKDWVRSVAVLPGGDRVVSASDDRTLKVWSLEDGSCQKTFEGHQGWVWSVAVLPGGDRFVSASEDKTLKVWSVEDGSCLMTLKGHQDGVLSVAVLPGVDRVVSASEDKTLKIWSVEDGSCLMTFKGHGSSVRSVAVLPGGDRVVSASEDTTLKIWNLVDGACERTLNGHEDTVWSVAVLPGGDQVVSASHDETLKFWSLENGGCERTVKRHGEVYAFVAVLPGAS